MEFIPESQAEQPMTYSQSLKVAALAYLLIAHGLVVAAIYSLYFHYPDRIRELEYRIGESNHDSCLKIVDGAVQADRISLVHKNGKKGVEIGTQPSGDSYIALYDRTGIKRMELVSTDDSSLFEVRSPTGMPRIGIGDFPNKEGGTTSISMAGSQGFIALGMNQDNASLSFIDENSDILGTIGFRTDKDPYLMLNNRSNTLYLKASNWFLPNRGLRGNNILPVSNPRNELSPIKNLIRKEYPLRQ